jgi:hypothetical protein
VPVFEEEYVDHHCQGSFVEVYTVAGKYALIFALIILHIVVTRKAILWFKPQWGPRKKIEF